MSTLLEKITESFIMVFAENNQILLSALIMAKENLWKYLCQSESVYSYKCFPLKRIACHFL